MYRILSTYKKSTIFIVALFISECGFGQGSFSFLNLSPNALTNAIGGVNASRGDGSLADLMSNPALLDSVKNQAINLNYSPYFAGIQHISLNYLWKENWAIGFQNLRYGDFNGTDALGNATNNFSANDYNLYIAHARKINNISFGVTAKFVGSFIENYNSLALLSDWGGVFRHPKKDLTFGITAKNVGFVLKSYTPYTTPEIPFDLQAGVTFKPQFMPIRFSLTAQHLQQFNIVYADASTNYKYDLNGNKIPVTVPVSEKIFRHFVFGLEILASKNINLLAGYNHLRQKELSIQNVGGASGFSLGVRLKYTPFDIILSYGWLVSTNGITSFSFSWKLPQI